MAFCRAPPCSYRHALQTTSPHLLRYLTAAVIITRRKRETLKELVTMIQQEAETFRDPVVEFLECLYVQFDFDGAQQKLRDCQQVFAIDSFLQPFREDFLESARLFVFETYCKIHRKIDLRYAGAARARVTAAVHEADRSRCVWRNRARPHAAACSRSASTWVRTRPSAGS